MKILKRIFIILKKVLLTVAVVFSLVTILRFFVADMFYIPSESMEATIHPREYVLTNKLAYGARWFNNNDIIRIPGYSSVKRNDIVVFNFPEGDTIFVDDPLQNYHQKKLSKAFANGEGIFTTESEIVFLPIQNRIAYIKRCVGIPGDTILIKDGILYCNNKEEEKKDNYQYRYRIEGNPDSIPTLLKRYGIPRFWNRRQKDRTFSFFSKPSIVDYIKRENVNYNIYRWLAKWKKRNIFPKFKLKQNCWSYDIYGPLYIPQKGDTLLINSQSLPIYKRLISVYERNKLKVCGNNIYINEEKTNQYIVKQDYYFMMGDNRNGSIDSRTWGFVPQDHIIGKAQIVLYNDNNDIPSRLERVGKLLN